MSADFFVFKNLKREKEGEMKTDEKAICNAHNFGDCVWRTVSVNATLYNRGTDSLGNSLIYDDDLNITWYDFSNAVNTWQNQANWANTLSINFGGAIYDDWRLPSAVDHPSYVVGYDSTTTAGWNITSSEMGHLFYTELGNKGYCNTSGNCPQSGWGLTNTGNFLNLQQHLYWSGTEYAAGPSCRVGLRLRRRLPVCGR